MNVRIAALAASGLGLVVGSSACDVLPSGNPATVSEEVSEACDDEYQSCSTSGGSGEEHGEDDGDKDEDDHSSETGDDDKDDDKDGCTLTQGYWKNHNVYGRAGQDPWPIDEDTTLCEHTWHDILWTPPRGDAWYILAHQWIAASLNVASGAQGSVDVEDALEAGQALLEGCSIAGADRQEAIGYSELLDDFNNGREGTSHCHDDDETTGGEDTGGETGSEDTGSEESCGDTEYGGTGHGDTGDGDTGGEVCDGGAPSCEKHHDCPPGSYCLDNCCMLSAQ